MAAARWQSMCHFSCACMALGSTPARQNKNKVPLAGWQPRNRRPLTKQPQSHAVMEFLGDSKALCQGRFGPASAGNLSSLGLLRLRACPLLPWKGESWSEAWVPTPPHPLSWVKRGEQHLPPRGVLRYGESSGLSSQNTAENVAVECLYSTDEEEQRVQERRNDRNT